MSLKVVRSRRVLARSDDAASSGDILTSFVKATQCDHRVQAAEGEGVGYGGLDQQVACFVGHVIEVAGRIRVEKIGCRRCQSVVDGEYCDQGFESASRAEGMPQDRLARRDSQTTGMIAKDPVQ